MTKELSLCCDMPMQEDNNQCLGCGDNGTEELCDRCNTPINTKTDYFNGDQFLCKNCVGLLEARAEAMYDAQRKGE